MPRNDMYTELEVKCLAILHRNVCSVKEVTYLMNKAFKRSAVENTYRRKILRFKTNGGPEGYLNTWREYFNRPKGDHKSLVVLREVLKDALDYNFIAEGGCLWDPEEMHFIMRSCNAFLDRKEIRNRLLVTFGHRRSVIHLDFYSMVKSWSHPGSPGYQIWIKYNPGCHDHSSGGGLEMALPSGDAMASSDGLDKGLNVLKGTSSRTSDGSKDARTFDIDEIPRDGSLPLLHESSSTTLLPHQEKEPLADAVSLSSSRSAAFHIRGTEELRATTTPAAENVPNNAPPECIRVSSRVSPFSQEYVERFNRFVEDFGSGRAAIDPATGMLLRWTWSNSS